MKARIPPTVKLSLMMKKAPSMNPIPINTDERTCAESGPKSVSIAALFENNLFILVYIFIYLFNNISLIPISLTYLTPRNASCTNALILDIVRNICSPYLFMRFPANRDGRMSNGINRICVNPM